MDSSDSDESESERRYEQLIETSPAPICLFDSTGALVWGNDAVLDLLGLSSREELVGRSIFDFLEAEDRSTAAGTFAEVVDDKTSMGPTAMQLQRADGESRRIRVATAPGTFRGEDIGQAVIIDVTELTDVQAKLESERRLIESALDTLQDVFYVINPSGELERWNETLLEVSGYDEAEIREMGVEDFFVEEDAARVSESIATGFAEGEDVLEATVVTKTQQEIPYEFRKRRLTRDGNIVGLVGIGRDISDQVARDQHLHAVDRLLQHHLRNQVNVIRGQVDVLREEQSGEPASHVDRIDAAAERLLTMFDDHHHIVKILTEHEEVEPIDVVDVVRTVIEDCRESYPSASITHELPSSATVAAIPVLDTAIREVVENAIQHNDASEPSAHVAVDTGESTVTVRIADNGPEIPEMEYQPLEDDTAFTPTFHSTGLGLWLVHWAMKRSGGTLTFDRTGTRGNVVTLELQRPNGGLAD